MDRNEIYVKKLTEIGNKINQISIKFLNVKLEEVNIEKLKNRHDTYLMVINEYKECKTAISNTVPPSKVRMEHEKMIDAIELFIDGTKLIFDSTNVNNCSIDKESMYKGILMQELGKKTTIKLTYDIGSKLIV